MRLVPTLKQKLVASKLLENGGNIGKAMVSVGYSPRTAKTPQKLTKSKGWNELMETLFPDDVLINTHMQLLNISDANVAIRALDMAYKLKGKYREGEMLSRQLP
jgi:hypothetical protein